MISNQKDHIIYSAEYIQRYWNGQLSHEEMHALEKAALDDPFLADAMEGMGEAMQQHDEPALADNLKALQQQLQAKTTSRSATAPVRSLRWWQAAAAAVVLIGAATWLFTSREKSGYSPLVGKNETAQSKVTEVAPPTQPATAGNDNGTIADSIPENSLYVPEVPSLKLTEERDSRPQYDEQSAYTFTPVDTTTVTRDRVSDKGIVSGKTVKAQQDVARMSQAKAPPPPAKTDMDKEPLAEVVRVDEKFLRRVEDTAKNEGNMKLQDFIKGVVTDHKNNPLPYAFVRVENYNNGYTTDPAGNFKIPVQSDSPINVMISSPGYTSRRLRLQNSRNDNAYGFNRISLEPNDSSAGITVMGSRSKGKEDSKAGAAYPKVMVQDAQPQIGWIAYEDYLANNKKIPEHQAGITGEVVVSFVVNKKGELSSFRIERSLSKQQDAEALRLVQQGPAWKLTKGRKSRVMVIVRF